MDGCGKNEKLLRSTYLCRILAPVVNSQRPHTVCHPTMPNRVKRRKPEEARVLRKEVCRSREGPRRCTVIGTSMLIPRNVKYAIWLTLQGHRGRCIRGRCTCCLRARPFGSLATLTGHFTELSALLVMGPSDGRESHARPKFD